MDNSRKGKKNKIRPGFGLPDYFKFYKKSYPENTKYDINRIEFRNICHDYNVAIGEKIVMKNFEFKLPYRLGVIFMRKFKPKLKIKNNVLINHNPPDFKKTAALWERDPEAKKNKILVRYLNKHTKGYIFVLKYNVSSANYKNKGVYTFTPVKSIKQMINTATKEYNIDAYIL